jgi:hypothetical protein
LRKPFNCKNATNKTEVAKMRNKKPEERLSQNKTLGSGAAIMAALMKGQPLSKRELIQKAAIDDSTFSRMEPLLLREDLIKVIDDKYYLFNYEFDEVLDDIFKKFVNDGRKLVLIEEVADLAGRSPESIIDNAYKKAKKYDVHIYYSNYVNDLYPKKYLKIS